MGKYATARSFVLTADFDLLSFLQFLVSVSLQ